MKKIKRLSLFIFLVFLTGVCCDTEEVSVNPVEIAGYLELDEGQKEKLMPVFEQVRDIFKDYYARKKAGTIRHNQVKKTGLDKEWITVLDKAYNLLREVPDDLNARQRMLWRQTKIYRLFIYERSEIMRKLMEENKEKYRINVTPTLDSDFYSKNFTGSDKLYDLWSVTFGSGAGLIGRRVDLSSIESEGRYSFPATITALLVDPKIIEYEFREKYSDRKDEWDTLRKKYITEINADNNILVRVSLFSNLHEKFVHLKNWIVYLEDDKERQIEPVKTEKVDDSWPHNEREIELPDFIKSWRTRDRAFRQRDNEMNFPGPERGIGMQFYKSYYLLYFPKVIGGREVISRDVHYLKLIFLREIGSAEKAEGVWMFNH